MMSFDVLLVDSLERITGALRTQTDGARRHFTRASVGLGPQSQVPPLALFPSQLY